MLTRRGFAGLVSCALCGLAEFAATEVSAQGTAPPAPAGFTRKILSQMDGPMPGYVTVVVEVTVDPGTLVARHTHPGIESGYVVSGVIELPIDGQPTRTLKSGEALCRPQLRMAVLRMERQRQWSSAPTSWRRTNRSHPQHDQISRRRIRAGRHCIQQPS